MVLRCELRYKCTTSTRRLLFYLFEVFHAELCERMVAKWRTVEDKLVTEKSQRTTSPEQDLNLIRLTGLFFCIVQE
jgi:hypothetical protein